MFAKKSASELSFGFVFSGFFFLIGLAPLVHKQPLRLWCLLLATVLLLISFLKPQLLYWPNRAWTAFGILLGRIVQPIVMGIIFLLLITPFAILGRIFAWDPLRLRWEKQIDSYWQMRAAETQPKKNLRYQF